MSDQVVTALTDGSWDLARVQAQTALTGLASLSEPPDPHDLASLWQVLGAVGYFTQEKDLIAPNLAQACAVDSQWFNPRLGADTESLFRAACAPLRTDSHLAVHDVPPGALVFVDGRLVEGEVDLVAGLHLVQVMQEGVRLHGALVSLAPGERVYHVTGLVPPPERRAPGWVPLTVAGATLGGGLLTWQAIRTWQSYQERFDYCADLEGGCADVDEVHATRRRAIALGSGGSACLAVSVGIGIAWAVRW